MYRLTITLVFSFLVLAFLEKGEAHETPPLTDDQTEEAEGNYQKYCALCHGANRQGHVNDHAPSLKSRSLLEFGLPQRTMAIAYGRPGTPMAGFVDDVGGPLTMDQVSRLSRWLNDQAGIPMPQGQMPGAVAGDIELGEKVYMQECSNCHGVRGEGGTGTALGNPAMLAMTDDLFLRHAIVNGRQDTEMPAFQETLSNEEIDGVTAFLRSRATGWDVKKPLLRKPPEAGNYVINADGENPDFDLKDGKYVFAADLYEAIQESRRMVILDTRIIGLWHLSHIEGSVPLPYYYERDELADIADDLPKDGTWIVTYCECPRAAAEFVNAKLVDMGFQNTAVLWEGAFGWVSLGYPVSRGDTTIVEPVAQY